MTISSQIESNRESQERADLLQFVKPMAKKHPQRTSIQHWQLRDLIHSPAQNKFLHANANNVQMYDTVTKQVTSVMRSMQFSPTSLTYAHGYVAAGGQRSQLIVKQLNGTWESYSAVGGSINNSLCISSCPWGSYTASTADPSIVQTGSGEIRLLVCNNDETIKVFSVPGMQRVTTIGLPTAVNYASVSPDGKKLCAVGDSNQVFIYDISTTGYYQRIASLTGSNDAGFSCSWNHNSDKIAVGSQDGVVSVWDIRQMGNNQTATQQSLSYGKLATIKSSQNPQVKGAVRSVKFSKCSSIDLLVFTEHVSYVNFIDARTFDLSSTQKQSIRLGGGSLSAFNSNSPTSDVHLSGLSFSNDSRSIYVGLESSVLEFDVDTISRRTFAKGALI